MKKGIFAFILPLALMTVLISCTYVNIPTAVNKEKNANSSASEKPNSTDKSPEQGNTSNEPSSSETANNTKAEQIILFGLTCHIKR